MTHLSRLLLVFVTIVSNTTARAADRSDPVSPLPNAYAHNDYWHKRPLLDALERGFTSVEADVFLVDGELLVGHERTELKAHRTLESLYLAPLARRVQNNGDGVFATGRRFLLLIDIKTDANETYRRLHDLLANYAEVLTAVDHGHIREGAVTVVLSGNRPIELVTESEVRYAGLDGRLTDLDSELPVHLMPMISDAWPEHFSWNGDGPMPDVQRSKLREIVSKAHRAGRILRFWATPENEAVWSELRAAGVDLLGTDQLDRLADFLRTSDAGRGGL